MSNVFSPKMIESFLFQTVVIMPSWPPHFIGLQNRELRHMYLNPPLHPYRCPVKPKDPASCAKFELFPRTQTAAVYSLMFMSANASVKSSHPSSSSSPLSSKLRSLFFLSNLCTYFVSSLYAANRSETTV